MHGERAGGEGPTAQELQPWGGADVKRAAAQGSPRRSG